MKNAHRKTDRKIRRIPPSEGSEVALEEVKPDAALTPASEQSVTPVQRLAVPVTDDGRIDVARLREKTKAALRHALSDPALASALGTPALENATSDEDAALIAQLTNSVFDGVSALSVTLAMRAGYRVDAARVLRWDKEEKATVAPLTGKVTRKYLPMLDGAYRDEILLGYQVLSIIAAKVMLLREASAQPPHQDVRVTDTKEAPSAMGAGLVS